MAATASGLRQPGTIYEMLLWLHGLGQSDKGTEKKKLENYITGQLCNELTEKSSTASAAITSVASQAKTLVQTVCKDAGWILKSIKKGQKETSVSKDEFKDEVSKLNYPDTKSNNDKELFDQFLYYLTCCYWQLRFLYLRCNTWSAVGGWGQCHYGQQGPESSDQCKDNQNHQQKHSQRCTKCSTSYTGCLQAFLTATNSDQGKNATGNNIYHGATYDGECPDQNNTGPQSSTQCPIPPMGFSKEKLPQDSKSAKELKDFLDPYFNGKDNSKSFPKLLGQLLALDLLQHNVSSSQSSLQLTVPPTWGLPHLFGFWAAFREEWSNNNENKAQEYKKGWEEKFNEELNANGQGSGTEYKWKPQPGDPDKLLEKLFKTYGDSEHNNDHNGLYTLTSCQLNNNSSDTHCGKYIHGLLENAFDYVVDEFKDNGLFGIFMNHETIKNFAESFYNAFNKFKDTFKTQTCVQQNQCTCIVFCDCTHSFMYQNGLTFQSPLSLAVKKENVTGDGVEADSSRTGVKQRKCSDLSQQLEHVLQNDAPLYKLTKLGKEKKEPVARSETSPGVEESRIPKALPQKAETTTVASGSSGGDKSSTGGSQGGTVQITHDKDGLDIFKKLFGKVLEQLLEVSQTGIDMSLKAIRQINTHHSSLLEPPCNIKECLEWLDILREDDKKREDIMQHLHTAVKALHVSTFDYRREIHGVVSGASALFNALKGPNYQPAYSLSAKWPVCGSATPGAASGVQCRGCQKTDSCKCQSSTSEASPCNGTCCDQCEVRTCAKIFCLIVPVLYSVLGFLYDKCLNDWCNQKLDCCNGCDKQFDASQCCDLYRFLLSCGFKDTDLSKNATTGYELCTLLRSLFEDLGMLSYEIQYCLKDKNSKFMTQSLSTTSSADLKSPSTICDMLLWLFFMPYSNKYKDVCSEFRKRYDSMGWDYNRTIGGDSHGTSSSHAFLECPLSNIFGLHIPLLFLYIEGPGATPKAEPTDTTGTQEKNTVSQNTTNSSSTDCHGNSLFTALHRMAAGHEFFYYYQDCDCQGNLEKKKLTNHSGASENGFLRSSTLPVSCDVCISKLIDDICEYVYEVHKQLRFLYNITRGSGGTAHNSCNPDWSQCRYSAVERSESSASEPSVPSSCSIVCHCPKRNENCSTSQAKPSASPSSSPNCHYPLKAFLTDKKHNKDGELREDICTGTMAVSTVALSTITTVTRSLFTASTSMGFRAFQLVTTGADQGISSSAGCCTFIGCDIALPLSYMLDGFKASELIVPLGTTYSTPTGSNAMTLFSAITKPSQKPLTLLTQYCIALQQREPSTVGELFELFLQLWNGATEGKNNCSLWERKKRNNTGHQRRLSQYNSYRNPLNCSSLGGWLQQEFSTNIFRPRCIGLTDTDFRQMISALYHKRDNNTHSSSTCDLYSLVCQGNGTNTGVCSSPCTPYLSSLSYGLWTLYVPYFLDTDFYASNFGAFHWLFGHCYALHKGLKQLLQEFRAYDCCGQKGSASSGALTSHACHASKGSDPCITCCPRAHPRLFQHGLMLGDMKALYDKKNCQHFIEALTAVLSCDAPLFRFIESFIWCLRTPFYWLTMALWIVATVYLLFVHFWRLDSWRMLSHGIRSRASHVVYPKVLLAAEPEHYDYAGL